MGMCIDMITRWTSGRTVYVMCDPVDERRVTQCTFNATIRLWFRGAPSPPFFPPFCRVKVPFARPAPVRLGGENKSGFRMEKTSVAHKLCIRVGFQVRVGISLVSGRRRKVLRGIEIAQVLSTVAVNSFEIRSRPSLAPLRD